MELFGAISSGDQWRSSDLNGIYSSDNHDYHHFIMSSDNSDDHHVLPNYDLNHISSLEIPFTIWPNCDSTIVHDSISSANMFLNIGNCDHNINHDHWPINVNTQLQVNEEESDMIALSDQPTIIGLGSLSGNISKKRARPSTIANNDQDSKSMRNVKPKKSQKSIINDQLEDVNEDMKVPISPNSPLLSDSNASHEELGGTVLSTSSPKGTALNLNGKTRASRGSATDPQSVYARKRREKINERLRTLQNLVPNGTKVDISTMLEEAVQYVKFLQLQIKLLSSDDLWMYAPLAYNGMGIGLDLGLNSPKL